MGLWGEVRTTCLTGEPEAAKVTGKLKHQREVWAVELAVLTDEHAIGNVEGGW